MAKPQKVSYYKMEPKKWKRYLGDEGCVPLNTQTTVSMDRLMPGETPPPKPKPTPESGKQQKADEERKKSLPQLQKKNDSQNNQASEEPIGEDCENPPVFDMLDIPDAMERMKWPVSATVARRWFNGRTDIYDDNPKSVLPIDDTSVTLDWALKFGSVKSKYDELLTKDIYSERAVDTAKKLVLKKVQDIFHSQSSSNLSFSTTQFLNDLRTFHIDWQFQLEKISSANTLDGVSITDLTGTLANFAINVAIGNVIVVGDKYYKYDSANKTKTYCIEPKVQITHVYVYIKDNYSFNDARGSQKSQYLGHWNKTGLIVSTGGLVSEFIDGKVIHTDSGNSKIVKENIHYLPSNNLDKPVDVRKGMFGKFRESDVYFPIYNRSYNEWRTKHNRGGDFMIYSKPKYVKLKTPIEFDLETLCRQPEKM